MKMKNWECNHANTCPFRRSSPYAYTCGPEGCPLANLSEKESEMEFDVFLREWNERNDAYAEQISRNYENERKRERRGQLWKDAWDDPLVRKAKSRVSAYEAQMDLLALSVSLMFAGTHTNRMLRDIGKEQHETDLRHVDAGDKELKKMRVKLKELRGEMNAEHQRAYARLVEKEQL